MYYPSSENKGADQLHGYHEADLRLCFRLCRLLVFPWDCSYMCNKILLNKSIWNLKKIDKMSQNLRKANNLSFRTGPTQTRLYSNRKQQLKISYIERRGYFVVASVQKFSSEFC